MPFTASPALIALPSRSALSRVTPTRPMDFESAGGRRRWGFRAAQRRAMVMAGLALIRQGVAEGMRVLVFYVDEFGQHGLSIVQGSEPPSLKRGCSPWFVLAAIGVRSSSRSRWLKRS